MVIRTTLRWSALILVCAVLMLAIGGCTPVPAVLSTTPANGATGVPVTTTVSAKLAGQFHAETINGDTFTLSQGGTPVPGQVSYDAGTNTATFTPAQPLNRSTLYTATLAKGFGAAPVAANKCLACDWPLLVVPVAVAGIAALAATPPDSGLADAFDWTFTTLAPNGAPKANAGPNQHVTLAPGGDAIEVQLDASGSTDITKSVVSYTWTGDPDPADIVNPKVTVAPGAHVFTLVVTDNEGATSDPATVTIFVNIPPVADAGPDQSVSIVPEKSKAAAPTVNVTLDGSASHDSDGTIVSYTWTGTPDPDDTVNPTVALSAGTYVLTLVVTDNDGAVSAPDTVTITVDGNTPPVAQIAPTTNPVQAVLGEGFAFAYDPGVLYGLHTTAYEPPNYGYVSLDWINPADGSVTKSVPIVLPGSSLKPAYGYGLAVDRTTGTLWALLQLEYDKAIVVDTPFLATLDPVTGVAHYVVNLQGSWPNDIACAEDGTLYALVDSEGAALNTVDKVTGELNHVLGFGASAATNDAITYNPVDHLMAHAFRDVGGVSIIEEIDLATFTVSQLLAAPPQESYAWQWPAALAFESNSSKFFLSEDPGEGGGRLSTVDVTEIGGVEALLQTGNTVYSGLAFGCKKKPSVGPVELDGSSSYDPDPADSIVSYAWTVTSVPTGSADMGVSDPAAASTELAPDVPGDYTVSLVVSDGKNLSRATDYTITYQNSPPVANAGADVIISDMPGSEACLDGSASYDVDCDNLVYSWSITDAVGAPVYASFLPSQNAAAACFQFLGTVMPGDYTVTLTVTEDKPNGLSATDTAIVTVQSGTTK